MVYLYCVLAIIAIVACFAAVGFIGDVIENVSDIMFEKKMMKTRRAQWN